MRKKSNCRVLNLPDKKIVIKKIWFFYMVKDEMNEKNLQKKVFISRFKAYKYADKLLGIKESEMVTHKRP